MPPVVRTGAEPAPLPGLSVWARMPRLGKRPARRNAAGPASGSGTPSGRGTRKEDDVSVGTRNGRLNLKPEGDNAPPVSACRKSPPAAAFSAKTRFPCACGAAGETCKETLLRKPSESTAHVSEAGRPLEAGSLSRASAGCLLQIEDLGKAPGIRNTARRTAALRTSLKSFLTA